MQSWPGSGQNGSPDEQGQWQSNFGFAGQNAQFDPSQQWSQPIADSTGSYAQHISPQDASSSNYFNSHQDDSFLSGHLHANPPSQPGFHGGHDTLALGQQYGQAAQDVIDPAFADINPDLYGQQGKIDLGDGIGHITQAQGHPHAHSQTQSFAQHDYAFAPQNEQPYESPVQQYAQPQLVPQQARQHSHTPVQQFESLHNGFAQGHGFSRPPQPSPVQHQQTPPQQPQQYPHTQAYSHSPVNGQHDPRYQANAQLNYQQPQQQGFAQPSYGAQKHLAYSQPAKPPGPQLLPQPPRQASASATQHSPAAAVAYPVPTASIDSAASARSVSSEPGTKKRKRVIKGAESPAVEYLAPQVVDLTGESKKPEEVDNLVAPVPTAEEAQLMQKFAKRSKAAQAKQPPIKGLPHLLYEGSVKLPGRLPLTPSPAVTNIFQLPKATTSCRRLSPYRHAVASP